MIRFKTCLPFPLEIDTHSMLHGHKTNNLPLQSSIAQDYACMLSVSHVRMCFTTARHGHSWSPVLHGSRALCVGMKSMAVCSRLAVHANVVYQLTVNGSGVGTKMGESTLLTNHHIRDKPRCIKG